jgi:RecQ-mediated genome instability protein 1
VRVSLISDLHTRHAAYRQPPLPPIPPSPPAPRSPLRSISPPPSPPISTRDDDDGPRRRRIPHPPPPTAISGPGSATQASGTTTQVSKSPSSYFTQSLPPSTSPAATSMEGLVRERLFSPVRRGPLPDAEEDDRKGDATSSEFDFGDADMGFDEQFFEEVQRVERDALGIGSNTGPSNDTSANERNTIQSAREPEDVIIMDSDLEGDDKENIPLPKRNVRRRVEPSRERDVIEIMSDSE